MRRLELTRAAKDLLFFLEMPRDASARQASRGRSSIIPARAKTDPDQISVSPSVSALARGSSIATPSPRYQVDAGERGEASQECSNEIVTSITGLGRFFL